MKRIKILIKEYFEDLDALFGILILIVLVSLFGVCFTVENTVKNIDAQTPPKTYDVINVCSYVQSETNGFGAITGSHIAYAFTYDDNGILKEETDFENLEHGLTKVKLSDRCYYEVKDNGIDCYRTLYLTKEKLGGVK